MEKKKTAKVSTDNTSGNNNQREQTNKLQLIFYWLEIVLIT